MSNILNETIIELMTAQEKKMDLLRSEMADVKTVAKDLQPLNEQLTRLDFRLIHLNKKLDEARFPVEETQALAATVEKGIAAWQQPKEVRHHHHAGNLLYVSACLFLTLVLVTAGWRMTTNDLDAYKANGIKYRLIHFNDNPTVQLQLRIIDSLFRLDKEKLQDSVSILEEEQNRQIRLNKEIKEAKEKLQSLEKESNPVR